MSTALRSLVITHAGGTRVLPSYTVANRTRLFAVTLESTRGTVRQTRVIGDRLENPSELTVTAFIQEASQAASYVRAYDVIDECESASSVSYHEGVQVVDGIVGASVTPDGLGVRLTLRFAPVSAAFQPLLTADNTTILSDSTLVSVDATVVP
jgi:hypothetical protein